MTKIYRETFRYFLTSLPALLTFAAIIEGMLWLLQPKSETSISFVALTIVAYFIHRHFLFGEPLNFRRHKPAADAPPIKFGWFLLLSVAFAAVPIGVALVIAFQFPPSQVLGIMLIVLFPLYLVTLGLFGTALPATVARDGTYRLSQGIRAVFGTTGRLIAGPGVVGAILLAVTSGLDRAIDAGGVPEDSLIILGYFIILRTLGFLTTICAVAVLCEMYRRTRPAVAASVASGPSTGST